MLYQFMGYIDIAEDLFSQVHQPDAKVHYPERHCKNDIFSQTLWTLN